MIDLFFWGGRFPLALTLLCNGFFLHGGFRLSSLYCTTVFVFMITDNVVFNSIRIQSFLLLTILCAGAVWNRRGELAQNE
jgi:hypothetical protein